MGANGIELPEWITDRVVERTYRRVQELRAMGETNPRARSWLVQGMNRARAKDPRMLLFLDKGAELLRRMNDEQVSRFAQEGYAGKEFSEFAVWRECFQKVAEGEHERVQFRLFGWILAAVAEALG